MFLRLEKEVTGDLFDTDSTSESRGSSTRERSTQLEELLLLQLIILDEGMILIRILQLR